MIQSPCMPYKSNIGKHVSDERFDAHMREMFIDQAADEWGLKLC